MCDRRVDEVTHPDIVGRHGSKTETFMNNVDYIFGAGDSGRYLMHNMDWTTGFATIWHLFFLVIFGLVTTNLLIAIVSECWEQSGEDHAAWRLFGRAAFSYKIRRKQLKRAAHKGEDSSRCSGRTPLCCGLVSRDGELATSKHTGPSGRWSKRQDNKQRSDKKGWRQDVTPFSPGMMVVLKPVCDEPKDMETELADLKQNVDGLKQNVGELGENMENLMNALHIQNFPPKQTLKM